MSEGPWTIIGTILAGLIFVISAAGLYVGIDAEFWGPKRRQRARLKLLSEPADVYFFIVSAKDRKIDYAEQDSENHQVKELTLQSNSTYTIELVIQPRVSFTTTTTIFGCEHDDVANRPTPIEFHNPFVVEGDLKYGVPGKDPGHNMLQHKHYSYTRTMNWTPGVHIVWGFRLKTAAQGVYPTRLYFCGGEVEGKADLKIRVEDRAPVRMTCASPGHEKHQIRPIFKDLLGRNV